MSDQDFSQVAIIDYGLGNLFSVKNACEHAGLHAVVTSSKQEVMAADAVVLPGVGAFGDAMAVLNKLDLVEPLREIAASSKPLVGICLGIQLFMTESYEFGRHLGLGIIEGPVVRFEDAKDTGGAVQPRTMLKVPHVGWNRIFRPNAGGPDPWSDTPLHEFRDGDFMYFVHSFYARPKDPKVILSTTRYGDTEFCSSLRYRNIFACQFHPERSGLQGLKIYHSLASTIQLQKAQQTGDKEKSHA